ncbi:MAG: M56 family metallopeptidase [Actinomycetia bacterium]|nr:M56 family metallopeptidase [Actinomycetes bacterium]
MTIAAFLLFYSLLVMVAGPPLLRKLTRGGQNPRLSVAAWLTAITTVLISWAAAVVAATAQIVGHWDHRQNLVVSCVVQLRVIATGQAGALLQIALLSLVTSAAVAAGVTGARLVRRLAGMRRRSHHHAEAVHLVGRGTAAPDVVVLDAATPAAYCVPGRPPAIVVTSAAMIELDEHQLGAVVAHERAHLAGRHPHIVAALRGLAGAFPRVALITQGTENVSRLLEMCADDAAARRHGRTALLSGLLAMTGVTPAGALGAADVAVIARAERLTEPSANSTLTRCTAALASTVAMMAAAPLLVAALAAAASGLLMCGMQ